MESLLAGSTITWHPHHAITWQLDREIATWLHIKNIRVANSTDFYSSSKNPKTRETLTPMAAVFSIFVLFRVIVFALCVEGCTLTSCASNQVCCSSGCTNSSRCAGQFCSSDSHCSYGQKCCRNKCSPGSDCIGYSCALNSDCGSAERCSGQICQFSKYEQSFSYDARDSIIVCSMILFCIISAVCIWFLCLRKRRAQYDRVAQQSFSDAGPTEISITHSDTPHPGQVPPSYEEHHTPYRPPQYEKRQTTIPPPSYSTGTTTADELPPPYTEALQESSGGVHVPSSYYGAVTSGRQV